MTLLRCRIAVLFVALTLAAAGFACRGSSEPPSTAASTPPAGPSATASATATATLPPATLDEGATLRDRGDIEDAIRVFGAIAATPQPGAVRQEALLAQ